MLCDSPTRNAGKAHVTLRNSLGFPTAGTTSPAQKGAATLLRHKNERRVDRLDEIRAQIANGTLVIRQMTDAEHKAAAPAAGETRAKRGLS
jgi:hypothetical protein